MPTKCIFYTIFCAGAWCAVPLVGYFVICYLAGKEGCVVLKKRHWETWQGLWLWPLAVAFFPLVITCMGIGKGWTWLEKKSMSAGRNKAMPEAIARKGRLEQEKVFRVDGITLTRHGAVAACDICEAGEDEDCDAGFHG